MFAFDRESASIKTGGFTGQNIFFIFASMVGNGALLREIVWRTDD
jgi:hypothetical protein